MKPSLPSTQHGQALVLMALAAVGLFAFAALAIDGSAIFSDRRHSQNASDTAAFAAALARVRVRPDWQQAGIDRAISNGYDESDGVTKVYVHLCSVTVVTDEGITLTCQGLPAGANPSEYVHVYIKSVVKLSFARVIGWQQMVNYTDAVVRASPAKVSEWFDGMALVSANTGCAASGDFGPFEAGGHGQTTIYNSGIFVNSGCNNAFVDNGNGNLVSTDPSAGVCVLGGIAGGSTSGIVPEPTANCPAPQIDINQFWMPDSNPPNLLAPYCSSPGSINPTGGGNWEATPGYFNKTGNQTFPDVSPAGVLKLQKGIYCLYNGIHLNAGWTMTTDLNDNDSHDPDTEGAFFYIPGGDVTFNGGASVEIHAMDSTAGGFPSELLHYLIYVPPSNAAEISISGSSGSTFTGTILAPTSNIDLIGNGAALDLHTQIIGYNTRISGSGQIDITYNPDDNAPAIIQPSLSPTE